jgi:hypothetical protein
VSNVDAYDRVVVVILPQLANKRGSFSRANMATLNSAPIWHLSER